MKIRIVTLLLAFQSLCLSMPFASFAANRQANDLNSKLSKHVNNYDLGVCTFIDALVRVSSEFKIPMGVVWSNTPSTRAQFPFAWRDATIDDMIKTIVKTQPGYMVDVRNGVLHISPAGSTSDPQNFLNLRLKSFEARNLYMEMASLKLRSLITPPKYGGISVGAEIEPKITVELKNCTVEDALDALVSASAKKIWIVTFVEGTPVTAAGLRESISLWGGGPSPEPVWDFLHWGDKIPAPFSASKQE